MFVGPFYCSLNKVGLVRQLASASNEQMDTSTVRTAPFVILTEEIQGHAIWAQLKGLFWNGPHATQFTP